MQFVTERILALTFLYPRKLPSAGQTRTVCPPTLILGILQSTHWHTAHQLLQPQNRLATLLTQDNAPPLPRPLPIQEAARSESRRPSNSLSGCPVRVRGFGCEPIASGPGREAGGRGRARPQPFWWKRNNRTEASRDWAAVAGNARPARPVALSPWGSREQVFGAGSGRTPESLGGFPDDLGKGSCRCH